MASRLLFHFNCYSALNCSIKCGPWHDGNNGLIRGHFHLIKRNKPLAAVQQCSPRLSLLKAFLNVCTRENWREREINGRYREGRVADHWGGICCLIYMNVLGSKTLTFRSCHFELSGLIKFLRATIVVSCPPLITMLWHLLSLFWIWQRSWSYQP